MQYGILQINRIPRPVYVMIAGFIATVFFDIAMYVDIALTQIPLHIPTALSNQYNISEPFAEIAGLITHYILGVGISAVFAYVVYPITKRISSVSIIFHAVVFAIVETIVAVWLIMLPLLGGGIAGLEISPLVPLMTISRHIVFGLVLGLLLKPMWENKKWDT